MDVKDRFTIYTNKVNGGEVIFDNEKREIISDIEADRIFQKEYGQFYSHKTKYLQEVINVMFKYIEVYNSGAMKGFEITVDDIIQKLAKDGKD